MTSAIRLPGHPAALAGLDWLPLPGLSSQQKEIRTLGRSVDAGWYSVWTQSHEKYVAFSSKTETKDRPVAAAALLPHAINDASYLLMISVDETQFWSFAVLDNTLVSKLDLVSDAAHIMAEARDFLGSLPDASSIPIYTDRPELFASLPWNLDIREFSLEHLAQALKPKHLTRARFARYSSFPIGLAVLVATIVLGGVGYGIWNDYDESQRQRQAAIAAQQKEKQMEQRLTTEVAEAINRTLPASQVIPLYLKQLNSLPLNVGGWQLTQIECKGASCDLAFEAQPMATWVGYIQAKPTDWSEPTQVEDIERVKQLLPINLPAELLTAGKRSVTTLPALPELILELGTLAQLGKTLGISFAFATKGVPVVTPNKASKSKTKIPLKVGYNIKGDAALLASFAQRLPEAVGMINVTFKLTSEKITFELKGEAYAAP
jgi:hypothetical protein